MKRNRWFLPLLLTTWYCSLANASEIVLPASQITQGGGSLSIYYGHIDQKIDIQTNTRDRITVGGNSYFSEVTNTLESNGTKNAVAAKLVVNPYSGLYYWLKAGSGSYELEVPSVTVKNTYSTLNNGLNVGAGIRKVLFPDTLFTPAIALDFGITYDMYAMDVLKQGGAPHQKIATKLELTELQAAVTVSKIIKRFEPYGGMKIFRTYMKLSDRDSLDSVNGVKDNAGIFLGAKYRFYPHEALALEGSFIGETSYTVSWNIEF